MKTAAVICCFLLAVIGLSSGAFALSIQGGTWNAFVSPNQDGSPFWDGSSSDGSGYNIGYWISKTGAFSGNLQSPGSAGMSYYGGLSTIFTFTNQGSAAAGLLLEVAGNAGSNVFGWYDTANPSVLHPIFDGSATPLITSTFIPTASFGFYLIGPDGSFYTDSALDSDNQAGTSYQHFAVFSKGDGIFYIGVEDLAYSGSDKDYNDMVIKISAVPEPTVCLLIGCGLVGLAAYKRRYGKR